MRTRGLLTGAAHFAGNLIKNPIKTTLNTIEGIKAGPDSPDSKILTGVAGAGGLVATFLGVVNRDPLLTSIGLTFTAVAGGIYEPTGGRVRAETHAQRVEAEEVKSQKSPVEERVEETPEPVSEEPAATEAADLIEPAAKPAFKPNLPRPKGLAGGP